MAIITAKLSQLRLSSLNQRCIKPSAIEFMADDIHATACCRTLSPMRKTACCGCSQVTVGDDLRVPDLCNRLAQEADGSGSRRSPLSP